MKAESRCFKPKLESNTAISPIIRNILNLLFDFIFNRLNLAKDVDLNELIKVIPNNFTGADFYGLTSQAVLQAAKRKIKEINIIFGNTSNTFLLCEFITNF
jgi:SpoVK/Ycf46/Vps4 family AAA+-type ATPase